MRKKETERDRERGEGETDRQRLRIIVRRLRNEEMKKLRSSGRTKS